MLVLKHAVTIGFKWLTRVPQKVVGGLLEKPWNEYTLMKVLKCRENSKYTFKISREFFCLAVGSTCGVNSVRYKLPLCCVFVCYYLKLCWLHCASYARGTKKNSVGPSVEKKKVRKGKVNILRVN
jgi:hypothetical protein